MRFPVMMRDRRVKSSLHLALRLPRILVIVGVEHRDHGYGAAGIEPGPLTLDQRGLHRFPVIAVAFDGTHGLQRSLIDRISI